MRKQHWELPAGVDRAALVASLTKHVLGDVDEVARCQRLVSNAKEGVAIAYKAGFLTQALQDELARREVELAVAVSMLVSSRGHLLEAEELARPLTESEQWDAIHEELQAAGRGQP